ncbi:MAG: YcaO-like family protein [Pseudomonadota bacterium]
MSQLILEDVLRKTVDLEYGLIRYLSEIPLQPGEPDIHIAIAEFQSPFMVPPRRTSRVKTMTNRQAAGAGIDRETAIWSTIGEAIERYAGMIYDVDAVVLSCASDLRGARVITPAQFIQFSDQQYADPDFPFDAYTDDKLVGWTKAENMDDGQPVWVPAALTFMGYEQMSSEEWQMDAYSTGLACGPTAEWATITALRELVERDSFSLHWAARRTPPIIDLYAIADRVDPRLFKLLEQSGATLNLRDVTTELGIPTVLSIVTPPSGPGLALGASCHPDPAKAVEKAIVESFHTYNWLLEMERWPKRVMALEEISSFSDHVQFHRDPDNAHLTDFLRADAPPSRLFDEDALCSPSLSQEEMLTAMVGRLADHGHEVFVVDMTPADVAALDFEVRKVLSPGLQPLWCGRLGAFEDRRRFDVFLKAFGLPAETPINNDPHPFP